MPPPDLAAGLRKRLIGVIRATFNDQAKGEKPVTRSDAALFPRDSVTWRVHGDVTTMMVGGVASLGDSAIAEFVRVLASTAEPTAATISRSGAVVPAGRVTASPSASCSSQLTS